jgi:hypothetical protein
MHRSLLFGVAALGLLSMPADARDGCGQGWFFNGVACAQEEGGYQPRYREEYQPGYREEYHPRDREEYHPTYRGEYYGGPRYHGPSAPNFYGNTVRPVVGNNGAISCSNPNYTWQDGACKPYRGP